MSRASRLHPLVVLALLTLLGSGCSALRAGGYSEGVRLHVHNESRSAVTVTTYLDEDVVDLGTVHPDNYPFFDLDLPQGREIAVVVAASSARDGEVRTDTLLAGRGSVLLLRLDRKPARTRWWNR